MEQTTVRMVENGIAIRASTFGSGTSLTARHVTAVGNGGGTGAAAIAGCAAGAGQGAALNLRNSILRGFSTDRNRSGVLDCEPLVGGNQSASASFEATHSIFDPAKTTENAGGSFTENGSAIPASSLGATNLNVDPLFASATDFHLTAGSPAIDAGDPAAPGAGELTDDLDGNPRTLDGDGDGTARRDIGAYEFMPDGDGDGVPDIRDACPAEAGGGTADGCPVPSGGGDGGGGGGGGDSTAPGVTLGGKAKQKADGTIEVEAACDEACTLAGDGTVKVKGKKGNRSLRAKAKTYGLGEDSAQAGAGEEVVLELKVPKKAGKAIGKALKKKGKASAALTITATDTAGNESTDERGVKLAPKKKKK